PCVTVLPLRARVMDGSSSYEAVGSPAEEGRDVLLGDDAALDRRLAQFALPAAGLAAGEVALAALVVLDLAAGGHADALLGALVGLLLRHGKRSGMQIAKPREQFPRPRRNRA